MEGDDMRLLEELLNTIKTVQKELEELSKETSKALRNAPEGSMHVMNHHGYFEYVLYKGKNMPLKRLSGKDIELLRSYAQRDYDEELLKTVMEIQRLLTHVSSKLAPGMIEDIYEKMKLGRKKLVKSRIVTDDQFLEAWLAVEYQGKEFREDEPEYISMKGERVRSKTEKIIADTLYHLNIPYRYEYPLNLKGYGIIYPDFTLLDQKTRENVYWEHFGMMENPEYCSKAMKKIDLYGRNGYYTSKNLLLTFESTSQPIQQQ